MTRFRVAAMAALVALWSCSSEHAFLGIPDSSEEKMPADSALAGIVKTTRVLAADYAVYEEHKRGGKVVAEETCGDHVYFAIENTLCVPLAAAGAGEPSSAMVTVTERYRAAIPD
jgi:hypothetical protein